MTVNKLSGTQKISLVKSFPQVAIRAAVAEVITGIYGIDWLPRAVRQQRRINVSSLAYIDYAVPCFELGKILRKNPDTIANEIARALEANLFNIPGDILKDAQFEAVGGYINICLSDVSVYRATTAAVRWFKYPTLGSKQRPTDTFLILGPRLDYHESFALTDRSYQYIEHLYRLLNKKHTTSYLINDCSEYMIDHLTAAITVNKQDPMNGLELSQLNRAVRCFLTAGRSQDKQIGQAFSKQRLSWINKRKRSLARMNIIKSESTYESRIRREIHNYLDSQSTKTLKAKGIIKDATSRAVYFVDGNDILPVRSANGMLYSLAYILYKLETVARSMKNSPSKTLIVIAPHKMHLLIHSFVRLSIASKGMPERVICFDPTISKADILGITTSIPSLAKHFNSIADQLSKPSPEWFNHQYKRQNLLELVDLPVELADAVTRIQLPTIFDMLSESADSLSALAN